MKIQLPKVYKPEVCFTRKIAKQAVVHSTFVASNDALPEMVKLHTVGHERFRKQNF